LPQHDPAHWAAADAVDTGHQLHPTRAAATAVVAHATQKDGKQYGMLASLSMLFLPQRSLVT
jgi:hypothetical protein